MSARGDFVLAFHAAWVAFNLIAPFWAWRRPRLRAVHLGTMGLTLLFAAVLGYCPLTPLEYRLSGAGHGGFLRRALWEFVYWDVPEAWIIGASVAWFLLWTGVYTTLRLRERATPPARSSPRGGPGSRRRGSREA